MKCKSVPASALVGLLLVQAPAALQAAKARDRPNAEALFLAEKWQELKTALAAGEPLAAPSVAHLLAGYACLATSDYNGALAHFSELRAGSDEAALVAYAGASARDNPDKALAFMLKGDVLARAWKYEEAIVSLDSAARLAPGNQLVLNTRGVVKTLAGRTKEARADFDRVLQLAPRFADALVNRGLLLLAEEDYLGALESLNQAIGLSPTFALAYNARGVVYASIRAAQEAGKDFEQAEALAPAIVFFRGNQELLTWGRHHDQLQSSLAEEQADSRGSSLVASSYERYSVPIGDGRTVDVIAIKNTPLTATSKGVETTLRAIFQQLKREARLPANRRLNPLIAQTGLGSSAFAERQNLAEMAYHGGKDVVLSVDMTDRFQWGVGAMTIPEDVSRRFERLVVATKHVSGAAPDVVLESQATRLIASGRAGSTTVSDLFAKGKLDPDFEINRVRPIGVPLPGMSIDDNFRSKCIHDALAIVTRPTRLGLVESEPLRGAASLVVSQRNGVPPSHGALFARGWQDGQKNPVPELVGMSLRGGEVQKLALGMMTSVPMVTSRTEDPRSVHQMVTATRRELTDPIRDGVLIGCKDARLGRAVEAQMGGGYRTKVVSETDPTKLQQMALAQGFTRINVVVPSASGVASAADHSAPSSSVTIGLPDLRSFAQNVDRYYKVTTLVANIANVRMPAGINPLALASPLIQDFGNARTGKFSPETSHLLERVGEVGWHVLPKLVDRLKTEGKLPSAFSLPAWTSGVPEIVKGAASQVGRRQFVPTVDEWTHYLDGVSRASWATVGALVAGPRGAAIASSAAGLSADLLRDATRGPIEWSMHTPVRRQMVDDWQRQFDGAVARKQAPQTFTEMYGSNLIQRTGCLPAKVAELDAKAMLARASGAKPQGTNADNPYTFDRGKRLVVTPRQDEIRRELYPFPPPPPPPPSGGGIAALPPTSHRPPPPPAPPGGGGVATVQPSSARFTPSTSGRGGVKMTADVIIRREGQKVKSHIFGEGPADKPQHEPEQTDLRAPFLLFCGFSNAR